MKLSIASLKDFLERYEFQHTTQPATDALPFDQIFVFLGADSKERPWVLNLRLFTQNMIEAHQGEPVKTEQKLHFLNFFISLPFEVDESSFPDISRLILLINKLLPIPGFGLSEIDKLAYYHYTYPCFSGEIEEETLLSLIALIIHLLNTHIPLFEDVGSKARSLEEVMADAAAAVENLE